MSDPNIDAADAYLSLQELAFTDFQHWCDERAGDENDIEVLSKRYAEDCENGSWLVGCKMPSIDSMSENQIDHTKGA